MGKLNLSANLRSIIAGFDGQPFLIREVFEKLDRLKIEYDPDTVRKQIPHNFKLYGWTRKIGKLPTNEGIYQATAGQPISMGEAITVIESRSRRKEPPPVKRTLSARIRGVVQEYRGDPFALDDVVIDLEAAGTDFNPSSVGSTISLMEKRGLIEVVDKIGRANIYRQIPTRALPLLSGPDPAPKPRGMKPRKRTFSAVCHAAMAGLERFSLQALAHGIAKGGDWPHGEALQKAPAVITRLRRAEKLTATRTRPVVYAMAPRWYLDNLSNMPTYCETTPHLEERILRAFGKHCGFADDPAPAADGDQPDPVAKRTAPPSGSEAAERLQYKLEDQGHALINAKNKIHDLESQNRKLRARIDRLAEVIDEKNRINATLQKRLNDARQGSKRPGGRGGGTFSLADLLHVSGKTEKGDLEIIDGTDGPIKERVIK
jgi:hypothetical protein